MKKVISSVLLTTMLAGAVCACTPNIPPEDPPVISYGNEPVAVEIKDLSEDNMDQYRRAYLNASFDLLKSQFKDDQNVMISPASIMIALSMTEAGAKGNTKTQMASLWGGSEDPDAQISYAAEMLKKLNNATGVKLHAADSMWVNEENLAGVIKGEFVHFVSKTFDSEVINLMFNNKALDRINAWVNEKTEKMIDKIIDRLDPDDALVLINAIAFDGKWEVQYEDDQVMEADFTNAAKEKQKVQMLYSSEDNYLENDLATGFIKSYEGGQYAFVVMLPKDQDQSADQMLQGFTGDEFDKYINSAVRGEEVRTCLPEFKCDYGNSLKEALINLGMPDAFDNKTADFTGIGEYDDGTKLYVGDVIHKTHIEVDRSGTKAAAVTAVVMKRDMAVAPQDLKEVYCNRPFAYAIVDTTDNTPVFIGTVNNI